MITKRDKLENLVFGLGLTEHAYNFIESMKLRPFQVMSNNFNDKIAIVNKNPAYKELILNSSFEVGRIEKSFKLDTIKDNEEINTLEIYKGVIPFILIQVITIIIIVLYPELTTWLPSKIFG